jgi:hypothetical protein
MNVLSKGREQCNRPATDQERSFILWLLQHSENDAQRFIPQLDGLIVASKCICGCPTIDFALKEKNSSPKGEKLISDFLATIDGQDAGVLLFEVAGQRRNG